MTPGGNSNTQRAAQLAQAIGAILDRLDAQDDEKFRNRRSASRGSFRKLDVQVQIFHPGGSTSTRAVFTRNLSATGIAFIHQGFVHNGTNVHVHLTRRLGGVDVLAGKVVHCAHIGGVFHQVGVKFEQKVFAKLYLDPSTYEDVDAAAPTDVKQLRGRVLCLDPQPLDTALLAHFLSGSHVTLMTATTLAEATEALKEKFDLLLCEASIGEVDTSKIVPQLRAAGHSGPICLMTAESVPAKLKAIRDAGVTGVLPKPFDQAKLAAILGTWLATGGGGGGEAILSSLADRAEMHPLINTYVQSMQGSANDLGDAMTGNKFDLARKLCMAIKGTGSSYGFAILSDAASEASATLDAAGNVADAKPQIRKLIDLCRRITAPGKAAA